MNEELMHKLCSTPEFIRCIGYDQDNPHHYLPLDMHMRAVMDNVEAMPGVTDKLIIAALLHDIGKPEVAFFDEKKGFKRFFGHAERSAEIAFRLLTAEGFTKEYAEVVCWYIRHHDDFISFKKTALPNHPFERDITDDNIAEVLFKSYIDIEGAPIDVNATVRYAITGKRPSWGHVLPWSLKKEEDMPPVYTAYSLLLMLCKADAMAQNMADEKLEVLQAIEDCLTEAFKIANACAARGDTFAQKVIRKARDQQ